MTEAKPKSKPDPSKVQEIRQRLADKVAERDAAAEKIMSAYNATKDADVKPESVKETTQSLKSKLDVLDQIGEREKPTHPGEIAKITNHVVKVAGRRISDHVASVGMAIAPSEALDYVAIRRVKIAARELIAKYFPIIAVLHVEDQIGAFQTLTEAIIEKVSDHAVIPDLAQMFKAAILEAAKAYQQNTAGLTPAPFVDFFLGLSADAEATRKARDAAAAAINYYGYLPDWVFTTCVKALHGTKELDSLVHGLQCTRTLEGLARKRPVLKASSPDGDNHNLMIDVRALRANVEARVPIVGTTVIPEGRLSLPVIARTLIETYLNGHNVDNIADIYILARILSAAFATPISIPSNGRAINPDVDKAISDEVTAALLRDATRVGSSIVNMLFEQPQPVDGAAEDAEVEPMPNLPPAAATWLTSVVAPHILEGIVASTDYKSVIEAAVLNCREQNVLFSEDYIRGHMVQKIRSHLLRAVGAFFANGEPLTIDLADNVAKGIVASINRSDSCTPRGTRISPNLVDINVILSAIDQLDALASARPYAPSAPDPGIPIHLTQWMNTTDQRADRNADHIRDVAPRETTSEKEREAPQPVFRTPAEQARTRLLSRQVMRITRDALATLASTKLGIDRSFVLEYLGSPAGEGLIEYFVGTLLGHFAEHDLLRRVGTELRVAGLTDVGSELADLFIEPIKAALAAALASDDVAATPPAMPPAAPAPTNPFTRAIDASIPVSFTREPERA